MSLRRISRSPSVVLCVLFAMSTLAVACSPPASSSVEDAPRGRTLRIVVGTSPGGGYDTFARVLAAHLGRHLQGVSAVLVHNMPGASGVIAANFLARQAPRDGLTVGMIGETAVLAQFMGDPAVRFDIRQFGAIGAPAGRDVDVCVMSQASGLDLEAWRNGAVAPRMAVTSVRSGPYARLVLLTTALALPVRFVVGYQGTSEMRLAIDGGEVEGVCTVLSSYRSSFEPKTSYRIVLQDGEGEDQLVDGVPVASLLVQDEQGRDLLDLAARLRALPRYFVVPPDTSPDRLNVLRTAFEEVMRDELYMQAAAAARLDVAPLSAVEVSARVNAVLDLPSNERERLIALLSQKDLP